MINFANFQYGGFLAVVFVLELGAGVSFYAYRDKLTTGFDNGLTRAMINYRNDSANIAPNFDLIQQTVRNRYFKKSKDNANGEKLPTIKYNTMPE